MNVHPASLEPAFAYEASPVGAPQFARDCRQLRLRLYAVLLSSDALAMAAGFLIANQLRFAGLPVNFGLNTFAMLFPVYVAVGLNGGGWSIAALSNPRMSAASSVRALTIAVLVTAMLLFTLKIGADFSRLVFGLGALLSILFMAVARLSLGRHLGEQYGWRFRKELLLLDDAQMTPGPAQFVIDAQAAGLRPATDDPIMLDRLAKALDSCERVIVACTPERRTAWSRMLAGSNADVEVVAPELDRVGALGLGRHGDHSTLIVSCGPLKLRDRLFKRLFDLAVSSVVLLLVSPLLVATAVAIRLESPGPVLFRQQRLGRGNRLFHMLKFRSMRQDTTDQLGGRSASRDDDRVTRVGRFIRRTSLDELPQLINVLKGEMSIVGPRPHPLGCTAEDQLFWAIEDRYFDRHAIKPGMTGLAQVRGFRGATHSRSDLSLRLQADLEYLDGWHIGRDLAILLRTVGVVVHPNAF